MIDIVKQLLTGKDNHTHDLARWSWLLSLLTIIGGVIWNTIHQGSFLTVDFAQAVAIIAGAHGVAIYAKKDTEPFSKDLDK